MIQRLVLILMTAIFVRGEVPHSWTLERLALEAEVIMHGRVTSTTCLRDETGRIYTEVEVEPIHCLKGRIAGAPKIVHSGGVLGEERVEVVGQVSFEPGEQFLAFLLKNERGEFVTVGMNAGKLTVSSKAAESGVVQFGGKTHTLEEIEASISNQKAK